MLFCRFWTICIAQRERLGVRLPANFVVRAIRTALRRFVLILPAGSHGVHWKDEEHSTSFRKNEALRGRPTLPNSLEM